LFALLRNADLGELALRLRRFLARSPAIRTTPPARLGPASAAFRNPLFLAPLGLGLATLAVLQTRGALLIAGLFALLLRA
jgi:hypothetical protein